MELLGRGVYRAPCLGPQGQIILFAVDHASRRIDNGVVMLESDKEVDAACSALWRLLDTVDADFARRKCPRDIPIAKIASLMIASWLPILHLHVF